MARLDNPIDSLRGEDRAVYDAMVANRAKYGATLRGPFLALLHNPALAGRLEHLGSFYKFESPFPRNLYQFVVLAYAAQGHDDYIYRDHEADARRAGVPEAVIAALHGESPDLPEPYAAILEIMDTARARRNIPDELQARAVKAIGLPAVVEVVTLCGFYSIFAMVDAAFDVSLDDAGKD